MVDVRIGVNEREIDSIAQRFEAVPKEVIASRRAVGRRLLRTAQRQFVQKSKSAGILRFPRSRIRDLDRRRAGADYLGIVLGLNPLPATFIDSIVMRRMHEVFVRGAIEPKGFITTRSVDLLFRRTQPGIAYAFFTRPDGQVVPLTRSTDPKVVREPIEQTTRPIARRVANETNNVFLERFSADMRKRIERASR